jgi:deoxyribose-phosphate aldolase
MAWTAGDYALIITTATTAVTAISGVGIPLWRDYVAKRDQRKEDVYRRVSEAVYFCVEHIEDVKNHDAREAMLIAWLEVEADTSNLVNEFSAVEKEFTKKFAVIKLIAEETDVSCKELTLHMTAIRAAQYEYVYENGGFKSHPKNADAMRAQIQSISAMISASANFLKEMKANLALK